MPVEVASLSDDDLVARVRAGDDAAFASLAVRYREWLVRVCTRALGDRHLAEDVAQETLVKAYRLIAADRAPDRLRPWLRVVARHACIDEQRRRVPEPVEAVPETLPAAPHDDLTSFADVVPEQLEAPLAAAWDRLNDRHREVLRQRELRGLSYGEISALMGVSLAAVETLLFRARAALRREYARAGGAPVPPETLARGLLLVDAGRVQNAMPVVRALGNHGVPFAADAAPAVTPAASSGALDGWRELAAGVAAAVLAFGLTGAPDRVPAPDPAPAPEVAVVVPEVPDAPRLAAPAPPSPPHHDVPDSEVTPPEAPDDTAADVPEEPDPSDAEEREGRMRRAAESVRVAGAAAVERATDVPRDVASKILP